MNYQKVRVWLIVGNSKFVAMNIMVKNGFKIISYSQFKVYIFLVMNIDDI